MSGDQATGVTGATRTTSDGRADAPTRTGEPAATGAPGRTDEPALLEVRDLRTHFFTQDGVVRAVDGVSLSVSRGRTLCVVGESGCGKSVTARSILGLVDHPGRIVGGEIRWRHRPAGELVDPEVRPGATADVLSDRGPATREPIEDAAPVDLATLDPRGEEMRRIRGREISMIFQEPMASLSPMYTVGAQLVEAIRLHLPMDKRQAREHAISLLRRVGIPRPEQRFHAYSFQLSGGMCQRAMIAMALACGPSLLIADEPTTALDVTTQARILDLIRELQAQTRMAVLFITHDLGVVAELADDVVVMYLGTVVERGSVDEIFHDPKHPYTRALLRSIPSMGRGARERLPSIRGVVPHPSQRPAGCPYHPRCDHAIAGLCDRRDPPTVAVGPGRTARCVLYDEPALAEFQAGAGTGGGAPSAKETRA
jgi:oligopeptide/dipeptide ABC transporter ATP-binding protein